MWNCQIQAILLDFACFMRNSLPTQEQLRELVDYDPHSGVLTWRSREGHWRKVAAHNARFAGKPAGNVVVRSGKSYLTVQIGRGPRYAHRVIYKLVTGEEAAMVDHANGDGLDNRISNLRGASDHDNQGNRAMRRNAQSGVKCVRKVSSGYAAYITKRGKYFYLGSFETAAQASDAYLEAAREYFGEFARP